MPVLYVKSFYRYRNGLSGSRENHCYAILKWVSKYKRNVNESLPPPFRIKIAKNAGHFNVINFIIGTFALFKRTN